jgi:hypothetical protein
MSGPLCAAAGARMTPSVTAPAKFDNWSAGSDSPYGLAALSLLLWLVTAGVSNAQELEPRAYSPNPTGANFALLAYGYTWGGVLFDPSLPFSDVEARLNAGVLGYGQTFSAFQRSASVTLALPYVWGDVEGNVGEEFRAITRSGPGDARFRFAVNLIGGPALAPAEFAKRTPRTTLGASLVVVAPLGEYDPQKLINIGSNRWVFKPELGIAHPIGRWYLEGYAGVWLFTDNGNYYGGQRREQDPLATFQAHVSYTVRPGLWMAFDATHYSGGRTTLEGVQRDDRQANTRVGLTLSVPMGAGHSLKVSYSEGATTRIGGDYTSVGIAWQYVWFD